MDYETAEAIFNKPWPFTEAEIQTMIDRGIVPESFRTSQRIGPPCPSTPELPGEGLTTVSIAGPSHLSTAGPTADRSAQIASNRLTCPTCNKVYSRSDALKRHQRTMHAKRPATALDATSTTTTPAVVTPPPPKKRKSHLSGMNAATSALNSAAAIHRLDGGETFTDLRDFLTARRMELETVLRREMETKHAIKWYAVTEVRFARNITATEHVTCNSYFRSNAITALTAEELPDQIDTAMSKIAESFESFQGHASGWVLDCVIEMVINVATFEPLAAACVVELPSELKAKRAILNIKNAGDEKCFVWSVLASLHTTLNHPNRLSNYKPFESTLDLTGISFPVPQTQIPHFERNNDVSVNVLGYRAKTVFPRQVTKQRRSRHANLLMVSDGTRSHYCCVRDMSRLLSDRSKHDGKSFYCDYCLHRFSSESLRGAHTEYCMAHGPQRITMPEEKEKWCKFTNVHMQIKVPYTIYADFESILVKADSCSGNPSTSHTQVTAHHQACGFAYVVIGPDGTWLKPPTVYRGEDAVDQLLTALQVEEKLILNIVENQQKMLITQAEEQAFRAAVNCHVCNKPLGKDRVRDHDHLGNGHYRGAAHKACNLNLRLTKKIPVFFHNLRGYDANLLLQGIGKVKDRRIGCIANNMQRYITFSLGCLHFVDSMQFLPTSLEKLVGNLSADKFDILRQRFPQDDDASLLLRKGVYPYTHMDSMAKFQEQRLPPIEAFFNDLTGEPLPPTDYQHAQRVWDTFDLQNMGEYHNLYVETDVLLLASVFENFRTLTMSFYGIDAAHNLTAASLAWNAALKMCAVELELITDPDIHLFVERGIRGGVCVISKRHAEANNKYLSEMDPTLPSKYIMYLDANNLYGHAMVQPLPHKGFRWLDDAEMENFKPLDVADDAETGYFLEVDLSYPEHLHELHNDFPLAPESLNIAPEMLSPYSRDLAEEMGMKPKGAVKLTPNLMNKERYVVHFRNLKLYIELGMVLTKVHRVVAFEQSAWLKPYIEFNTERRKEAKTPFEKDFFKLLNNSVFGKTMENLRNHVDIHLVQTERRMKKLVASPAFQAFNIFDENLVGVSMAKTNLLLNRPIYAGMAILDVSKIVMFNFHYKFIKERYGDKAVLLFTDTDSLCYEIETEDVYRDFGEHAEFFDFSDYPVTHPLHSDVNKKRLGKMKDELSGVLAEEFVGLRPKMYSLKSQTSTRKTAKGVGKAVVRNVLRHEDYRRCLLERSLRRVDVPKIASVNHQLYTVISRKIGLSPYDDKRFILPGGIDTLAHGHRESLQ